MSGRWRVQLRYAVLNSMVNEEEGGARGSLKRLLGAFQLGLFGEPGVRVGLFGGRAELNLERPECLSTVENGDWRWHDNFDMSRTEKSTVGQIPLLMDSVVQYYVQSTQYNTATAKTTA